MSYRILTAALAAAGFVFATQSFAEPTRVKASKSNSSDRFQGPPRGTGPTEAINLNSSKSNIYRQGSSRNSGNGIAAL
jgi:hypothetical protein